MPTGFHLPLAKWFLGCSLVLVTSEAAAQSFLDQLKNRLTESVKDVTKPANPSAAAPAQDANAGYLGLTGDDAEQGGVTVLSVRAGSPADVAGVRPGDVVTALNGAPIRDADAFASVLSKLRNGDKALIELTRTGQTHRIQAKLGPRPGAIAPVAAEEPIATPPLPEPNLPPARAMVGVSVTDVTPEAVQRWRLAVRQGALIEAIQPGTPADQVGLPIGGVIVSIDGRKVASGADFLEIIQGCRPGQAVQVGYYQGDRQYHKQVRLAPADAVVVGPGPGGPGPVPGASGPIPKLESMLSDGGRRPVLGRLGRALDQFADPAAGAAPPVSAARPVTPTATAEIEALSRQIEALQRQVELLQQRVEQLEKKEPRIRF